MARLKTGVPGLDEQLQGGLIPYRIYLLNGPPGAGKTTFSMQFLIAGAERGEEGVFISAVDAPEMIVEDMSNYTFNLRKWIEMKRIFLLDLGAKVMGLSEALTPIQKKMMEKEDKPLTPQKIIDEIKRTVKVYNIKRLVIDSIASIRFLASDEKNARREIERFIRALKQLHCTTLLLSELANPAVYTTEEFLCHGVFFLHHFSQGGRMLRAFQIIKMRGTKIDCDMKHMEFTDNGLCVSSEKL